jgi:hypothetical protein
MAMVGGHPGHIFWGENLPEKDGDAGGTGMSADGPASREPRSRFAMPMPPTREICAPICSAIMDFQIEPALPLP